MIKIKNNILIKNIIILLISGAIAKVIGMLGKIIYTRIAGVNVVSLYALMTPTFMLIITICQFSFPISISKLSAEEKYKDKDLLKAAYLLGLLIDLILSIIIFFSSSVIANMLHNKGLRTPITLICLILPFISISSIQRGFLHGKENMLPASISNIIEEIIKIILTVVLIPISISKSNITAISFLILFNIITESCSIFIMSKAINKLSNSKEKSILRKEILSDIISISIPTTSVRLISSFGFFLEPILLTNILLKTGYQSNYIILEYGIINSYIIPLLSMPNFFSISIASALLPNITKEYANKNYRRFNSKLIKLLILSLLVGVICLGFILIFPKQILNLVYNVNLGINYIYLIGPFFLILYMQPTLSAALQSMNKTNKLFLVSIIQMITKYVTLLILGILGFGMNSLIYSIISGIIITTVIEISIVLKELSKKSS